jgi:hypothetical protein
MSLLGRFLIAVPYRQPANSTMLITNTSSLRFSNFTNTFGGNNPNFTSIPDIGTALWTIVNVYPDFLGQVAWFILFAIPFLMMWLSHADMVPAAAIALVLGIYIVGFVGDQYFGVGMALCILAGSSIVWSLWLRRL